MRQNQLLAGILCETSGAMRRAFAKLGHTAMSCDILPADDKPGNTDTGSLESHWQGDCFDVLDEWYSEGARFDLIIAHPPCTYLCNSGVRWLYKNGRKEPGRWRDMYHGAEFFVELLNLDKKYFGSGGRRIAVENPVMHKHAAELIGSRATQFVQPWMFGEPYFKATGFHLVNLPRLVPTRVLTPPKPGTKKHKIWSAVHRASPGQDRWKERSATYQGIANACAAQWSRAILASRV